MKLFHNKLYLRILRFEHKNINNFALFPLAGPRTNPIVKDVQDPQPSVADQPSAQAATRPAKMTLVKWLDLVKTDGDERLPFVTGLDFMSDGRIAAVDAHNKKCFIMNAELQRQGSAFRYECYPYDVSCYKESALAVTLWYVQNINFSLVNNIALQ